MSKVNELQCMRMMHQASGLIHNLLINLTRLYRSSGIKFSVHQFEATLKRILCPIQLSSYVDRSEVEALYDKGAIPGRASQVFFVNNHGTESQQHSIQYESSKNVNKSASQKKSSSTKDYQLSASNVSNMSVPKSAIISSMPRNNQNFLKDVELVKAQSDSRAKSRGLESYLTNWLQSELDKGAVITKKTIMEKARHIGGRFNFKGCPRWCDHFLARHPTLKEAMYRRLQQVKLRGVEVHLSKDVPSGFSSLRTFDRGLSNVQQYLDSKSIHNNEAGESEEEDDNYPEYDLDAYAEEESQAKLEEPEQGDLFDEQN